MNDQRPGFLIIERYMPDASDEERERAYERLCELIGVLVRINDRLAREQRDSTIPNRRLRIPPQSV